MITQTEIENLYPSLENFDQATQTLLQTFHQSKEASQLTRAVKETAVAGMNLSHIRSEIVGRYFEEIAGLYIRSTLESKTVFITTPSETNWIFQQFFPDNNIYSLYDLKQNIIGITLPDGLMFKAGKRYCQLTGVCEYTALKHGATNKHKQEQFEYFQPKTIAENLGMYEEDCTSNSPVYGRRLRRLLDHIRPDIARLPISLASPDAWQMILAVPATSDQDKGQLSYLPINRAEFHNYISQLLYNITHEYHFSD